MDTLPVALLGVGGDCGTEGAVFAAFAAAVHGARVEHASLQPRLVVLLAVALGEGLLEDLRALCACPSLALRVAVSLALLDIADVEWFSARAELPRAGEFEFVSCLEAVWFGKM